MDEAAVLAAKLEAFKEAKAAAKAASAKPAFRPSLTGERSVGSLSRAAGKENSGAEPRRAAHQR